MRGADTFTERAFTLHRLEDFVPGNHPLRPIRQMVNEALVLMDALFLRALRPTHASTSDGWTPLARWLLYVRGHWMRMPPKLLILHLARKAWMSWLPDKKD